MSKIITFHKNLPQIKAELRNITNLDWTDQKISRISIAGNPSGTAFHHWRWKMSYLPDLVIWPTNIEQIMNILQLANKYQIPITPRGGGTCYFGGSTPALGGIVVDLKRFHKLHVNTEQHILTVESGAVFLNIEKELLKYNLTLGIYPSSFLGATIGGWFASGGTIGIGTHKYGSLWDYITRIKYVNPKGEIVEETTKANWHHLVGTNGIFGIIIELDIKLITISQLREELYLFKNYENLHSTLIEIKSNPSILYIRFSDYSSEGIVKQDQELQISSLDSPKRNYYLYILSDANSQGKEDEKIKDTINRLDGLCIETKNNIENTHFLNEISNFELILKKQTPILMLQHYLTTLTNSSKIVEKFKELAQKYQIPMHFYGQMNSDGTLRLICFCLTDNKEWIHFLASKAILHELMKLNYKLNGKAYSYGLLNTFYLLRYEKQAKLEFQKKKFVVDPKNILNLNKIVNSKISLSRIDLMFSLALIFRLAQLKKK